MASEAGVAVRVGAMPAGAARHELFGLPFDALTLADTVRLMRQAAHERRRLFLSTANVNFVVAAQRDPAFRASVLASDLCVADGAPIVWMSRWLGVPLPERVAGSDLFDALRRVPREGPEGGPPLRVYFFGGAPGVAERAAAVLEAEQGGLVAVGWDSPGYVPVEAMSDEARIARINAARPDFLVVSLGAAKGQAWIMRNLLRLDVPLISHLGAVVNFVAGEVRRAPPWMQRSGLEWAWRVKEEPALLRRYAGDALRLLPLAWRERTDRRRRAAGGRRQRLHRGP